MTDNTITFHEPVRPGDVHQQPQVLRRSRPQDHQARHRPLLGDRRGVPQPATTPRRRRALHRLRLPEGGVTAPTPVLSTRSPSATPCPSPGGRRHPHHRGARRPRQPRLAADAPRLQVRDRAQRRGRHLPEHPEPGGLVRAVRDRLDRSPRPPRPDDLPHEGLDLPRGPHGLHGDRALLSPTDELAAAGLGSSSPRLDDGDRACTTCTVRSRCPRPDDNPWARRGDGDHPWTRPERDTHAEPRLHRRTGHAARDGALGCAPSTRLERAGPGDGGRPVGYSVELWAQLGELGLLGADCFPRSTAAPRCRCSRAWSSTRSSAERWPRPRTWSARGLGRRDRGRGKPTHRSHEWLPGSPTGEAIVTPAWLEPE
jgi:hypothetical protein